MTEGGGIGGRGKQRQTDPGFQFFRDKQAWIGAAAKLVFAAIRKGTREGGTAAVSLAGGRTPQPVYERLGSPPYLEEIPWRSVHLFWGDERCVPGDDAQSNYGMARAAFLGRVPLPAENVHPVPVTSLMCRDAADRYEQDLRHFFKSKSPPSAGQTLAGGNALLPVFDLILLGLGKDGHTASLFPGSPALEEQKRWAVHVPESPQPPFVPRITLTLPVINKARMVIFLVSGIDKAGILAEILSEANTPYSPYPAARVKPTGELIWLVFRGE